MEFVEYIASHPEFHCFCDWTKLSKDPTITPEIILAHPELSEKWNWVELSKRLHISRAIFSKQPELSDPSIDMGDDSEMFWKSMWNTCADAINSVRQESIQDLDLKWLNAASPSERELIKSITALNDFDLIKLTDMMEREDYESFCSSRPDLDKKWKSIISSLDDVLAHPEVTRKDEKERNPIIDQILTDGGL